VPEPTETFHRPGRPPAARLMKLTALCFLLVLLSACRPGRTSESPIGKVVKISGSITANGLVLDFQKNQYILLQSLSGGAASPSKTYFPLTGRYSVSVVADSIAEFTLLKKGWFAAGLDMFVAGKLSIASGHFSAVLEFEPSSHCSTYFVAICQLVLNSEQPAGNKFLWRPVIALFSRVLDARKEWRQGDAAFDLQRLVEMKNGLDMAYLFRGLAYLCSGDRASARSDFQAMMRRVSADVADKIGWQEEWMSDGSATRLKERIEAAYGMTVAAAVEIRKEGLFSRI